MAEVFTPLYLQIASEIRNELERDALPAGTKLPHEGYYMERYGVSRVTVRHAFEELINAGYLKRIPYRGLYVSKSRFTVVQSSSLNHLFETDCNDLSLSHVILAFGDEAADEALARVFRCPVGTPLYHLKILRKENDTPFVVQETYLRVSFLPKLDIYLLKDRTLHDIIENHYHHTIDHISHAVSIVQPSEELCRYLHAASSDRLLQVTDELFVQDGEELTIIRYGTATYARNVNYRYTIHASAAQRSGTLPAQSR